MTVKKFSKAHEREEARLLRKGFVRSWTGLLLCWLPVAGLLFAIGGFLRTVVRITRRHRVRRRAYLAFAVLVMTVCVAVTLGEVWVYSRDPAILRRLGDNAWTFVTGQQPSDDTDAPGGTNYTDMDSAGLGVTDGLQEESDGLSGDDWSEWDEDFDWSAWEDTTDWDDEDLWFEDESGAFVDGEADFGEEETGDIVWLDGTEGAADGFGDDLEWPDGTDGAADDFGDDLEWPDGTDGAADGFGDELEWLDENDDGIIWLDENGQELPPETTLYVGAGEQIKPQEQ